MTLAIAHGDPILARVVAERLSADVNRSVLVFKPHQGCQLDAIDKRCIRVLGGAELLVVLRAEGDVVAEGDGFLEQSLSRFAYDSIKEWVARQQPNGNGSTSPVAHHAVEYRELLESSAGVNKATDIIRDEDLFPFSLDKSAGVLKELLLQLAPGATSSAAELYYSLIRLGHWEAGILHRLSGRLADPAVHHGELGRVVRTLRLVEAASALRDAIRARWGTGSVPAIRSGSGAVASSEGPRLFFVDDHIAEGLKRTLRLCAKLLWFDATLWQWNPLRSSPKLDLSSMIARGAVGPLAPVLDAEIEVWNIGEDPPACHSTTLRAVLTATTHVIVDQLFEGDCDAAGLRGPEMLRFFSRLLPALPNSEGMHRPRRVAFSRNREPELIAAALRAGADGYVLKSEPARLTPLILARTVPDYPKTLLSRNFAGLEHLPPRIRDLVQGVEIPKVNYRRWFGTEPGTRDVARLLEAIPKAELHVHAGSCMSRDFLVVASVIGLASDPRAWKMLASLADLLRRALEPKARVWLTCMVGGVDQTFEFAAGAGWMAALASSVKRWLLDRDGRSPRMDKRELRSILRSELRIPDYLSTQEAQRRVRDLPNLPLVLMALRTSTVSGQGGGATEFKELREADLVRLYLIVLALRSRAAVTVNGAKIGDINRLLQALPDLREAFYGRDGSLSVAQFRAHGWRMPPVGTGVLAIVRAECGALLPGDACKSERDPIGFTLATGLESKNLIGYLEGCDFSGSIHLQHPYLIHLFARQVLFDMVREGTVYRELRASPDGYASTDAGFSFGDACSCLVEAFSEGQEQCVSLFESTQEGIAWLPELVFGADWGAAHLGEAFRATKPMDKRLPPKVGLLLVGKRHKASREMILEAAAGAVLYQEASGSPLESGDPLLATLRRSGIVGFDLAGQESDFPPALFAAEFERLGKLHIPLTVHAGENASAQFVEDAVLILGARRIGHALSLTDDRHLMERLREDRICVELCPVSNHQTSHFADPADEFGRKYPLEEYLAAGIPVCLNTDNPIISRTDLINEFFVASSTMRKQKMTLWLALLLVKTALRSCFLPLPQRRILVEAADNSVEYLLQDPEVVDLMERCRSKQ